MPTRARLKKEKDRQRKALNCINQSHTSSCASDGGLDVSSNTKQLTAVPHHDAGVHEELFNSVRANDVMEEMVSIETMDYITQVLKAQFPNTHGLYIPSCVYAYSFSNQPLPSLTVPRHVDCVQIHFINSHYVVSAQKNGVISLYDSLRNDSRVQSLMTQLSVIYELVSHNDVEYVVPQSQGKSNLCAMFAIANTLTLLMGTDPSQYKFENLKMRQHLRNCLINGQVTSFPCVHSTADPNQPFCGSGLDKSEELIQRYFTEQSRQKRQDQIRRAVQKKRQDILYRKKEETKNKSCKSMKRKQFEFRQKEREMEALSKIQKRKNEGYYHKEKQRETPLKKQKRTEKRYCENEMTRDKEARCLKRKDASYQHNERQRETPLKKKKRKDKEYYQTEKQRETQLKKKKRADKGYCQKETQRVTQLKKKKRTDEGYCQKEKQRETQLKKKKRTDEGYCQKEKQRETQLKKKKRTDEGYCQKEKQRETQLKKKKRADKGYCQKEKQRETQLKKKKRTDEAYCQNERTRENVTRGQKRTRTAYKVDESERETLWKRTRRKDDERYRFLEHNRNILNKKVNRRNPVFRGRERIQNKLSKRSTRFNVLATTVDKLIEAFHRDVSDGPLYICTCCEQSWYRCSVVKCSTCKTNMSRRCFQGVISHSGEEWLCKTCLRYLKKDKMPPLAISNGMSFPLIPEELDDLHTLEERLVAPRIPFMKIFQAPRGGQLKLQGNVVNVPCNVISTVSTLPRLPNEDGTIRIALKRRLSYTSSVVNQNVRPNKVKRAAEWLVCNGPLYKRENITFNEKWDNISCNLTSLSEETDSIPNTNPPSAELGGNVKNDHGEGTFIETEDAEIHGGSTDTMLSDPSFIEAEERDHIWSVAPGQYNHPVSIFRDIYSEELSFPSIFCGQARPSNRDRETKVYYSDIVKSELRRRDRIVAKSVDNIFFKTKKIQMHLIFGKMQIAIRKYKTKNQKLTAGTLKQEGAISRLIHLDEGYRVLRSIRGSPPYFEQAKKDLFAMIRSLGPATFFLSFSAAETHWKHLLQILSQTVDSKEVTMDDIDAMSWMEKCRLIQSDPVTCSRHFHHSVQTLLKFLQSPLQPLGGNLRDFFYRVEYQHRGSPHIHMLAWVDGAPKFNSDEASEKEVVNFVDKIVSCSSTHEKSHLQLHRHSRTCPKGNRKCRFNYPQPPMRNTVILHPIVDPTDKKKHGETFKVIKKMLVDMKCGSDIEFDEMLQNLSITEEEYLLAVSSSISTPSLFLKRKPCEIRINPYVPVCLSAWRANMDAQYIMDIYSCAMYVVGYISKSQRGLSMLLDRACQEARQQASNIREQVRLIGNKFTNNVEISAQEAVDICLQMSLRRCSRKVVFIPTSPPEERTFYLKSMDEISELDDDSQQIAMENAITRYMKRHKSLENITLADWVSLYDGIKTSVEADIDVECCHSDYSESCHEDQQNVPTREKVPKKRKVPRVLRYVRYNKETHREEFCREKLMLFTSWRNEDNLMGHCSSFQERYIQMEALMQPQLQLFEPSAMEVDLAEKQIVQDAENQWDELAPNTQHQNRIDLDTNQEPSEQHTVFLPPKDLPEPDMGQDLGIPTAAQKTDMLPFDELTDQDHRELIRSLNHKQREFFSDIMYRLKTSQDPIYTFLSGGAGVGKSRLLTAIYQTAMKYFNSKPGSEYNARHVLVVAPTGKAAFNVHGNTIQSSFKVLPNQRLSMDTPTSEKLNTLRCELGNTKLIIIDEISMVGLRLFNLIHKRMQDIKGSSLDFGGISVLCFGDLFQFKPVFDCFLFSNNIVGTCALSTNLWKKNFEFYELIEIMRQRDCIHFAQLLNRLREGQQTEADIAVLESRLCTTVDDRYPNFLPHLFLENSRVSSWNHCAFLRSDKPKQQCTAHDVVVGDVSSEVASLIKKAVPDNPSKTMQLHTQLNVGIDLNFEVCLNINTSDGLTNGASGIVKHIDVPDRGNVRKGTIWLQFPCDRIGRQARSDHQHLYRHGIDRQWVPIVPVSRNFKVGRNGDVMRTQFPIRPSAAKTLHRAQGETFTDLVVDFSVSSSRIRKSFFEHAHYVGLSRVTTLDGLHILNMNKEMIGVNQEVKAEMHRLRNEAAYCLSTTPIYAMPECFTVCYNNTRSFHKHYEDCSMDPNLQAANVCIFTETRLFPSEPDELYTMHQFTLFRNDERATRTTSRPPHGTAVYTKVIATVDIENVTSVEITSLISQDLPAVTIIGVYKHPRLRDHDLAKLLNNVLASVKTPYAVIIGDMNLDLNKLGPLHLLPGYRNHAVGPTTDSGTAIDHVYSNLPVDSIQCGALEAYWSDHKIIWVAFKL